MTYDPLSEVIDEPLHVDAEVIATLVKFRSQPKLRLLPGVDPTLERERLSKVIDDLLDILVVGIESSDGVLSFYLGGL